jgi:hypothetical protein
LPHRVSMVFPECVAKLHASPKRFDRTKNPFKPLFYNSILCNRGLPRDTFQFLEIRTTLCAGWSNESRRRPIHRSNRSRADIKNDLSSTIIVTLLMARSNAVGI